jgi:hypothetical protein
MINPGTYMPISDYAPINRPPEPIFTTEVLTKYEILIFKLDKYEIIYCSNIKPLFIHVNPQTTLIY